MEMSLVGNVVKGQISVVVLLSYFLFILQVFLMPQILWKSHTKPSAPFVQVAQSVSSSD